MVFSFLSTSHARRPGSFRRVFLFLSPIFLVSCATIMGGPADNLIIDDFEGGAVMRTLGRNCLDNDDKKKMSEYCEGKFHLVKQMPGQTYKRYALFYGEMFDHVDCTFKCGEGDGIE